MKPFYLRIAREEAKENEMILTWNMTLKMQKDENKGRPTKNRIEREKEVLKGLHNR